MPGAQSRPNPRGKAGEDYVAGLLLREGMRILARNYRSRYGEIDIIATDSAQVCFVEVKARRAGGMVSGEDAVSLIKQRRIIKTALCWMRENACDLQPRFDVCAVTTEHGLPTSHEYYIAAFDGGAYENSYR